ncbi:MAG: tRNA threonylcarbamoyladenosine dehydratase [Candidatus Cloacimonas sp.]|nr:tRNA threonylcarbamoyladenosine dehydratase [Candidatus Cloacimonadota bacterium]
MKDQRFNRTALIFGDAGMKRIKEAKIAVVGLGGVGSAIAEMLVRSGIGSMLIVDFDSISITNINRQITALDSTVSRLKTEVLAERLRDINPELNLTVASVFCDETNRSKLLSDSDFIVDAIDSLTPKVGLIEYAYNSNIKIISCMGAANRVDPSMIRLNDIGKSSNCPLAARVRRYLNKRGIVSGVPVVYSIEKPLPIGEPGVDEAGTLERGRKRTALGSTAHLPAAFASWAVSYILRNIAWDYTIL